MFRLMEGLDETLYHLYGKMSNIFYGSIMVLLTKGYIKNKEVARKIDCCHFYKNVYSILQK